MEKKQAHIISHSHWDREWYFTFEEYRIRLVNMVDKLLNLLEEQPDFHAFMLDGHTVLVEDYLEIKPFEKERLKKHIANGRIIIGPWYVLPDQVLISGESHIRNYLFGKRICDEFGGNMQLGYAPDAFGHPAQIPQIYHKLGLKEIFFWRGLNACITKNEFRWFAPDGSIILGVHLPYGYGNCPNLPAEPNAFLQRVRNVIEHYAPTSTTNIFPIMNGRDHLEPQPHVPAMIEQANALCDDIHMKHSSLPEFARELEAHVPMDQLEEHHGALYSNGKVALLEGTLSTRMYLKQMLQQCEDLYEGYLEPLCSIRHVDSMQAYPLELINQGWKNILKNQPHDSICGCCIDEVHHEMETRFHSARQIGDTLADTALENLAQAGAQMQDDDENYICVFNPMPQCSTQTVSCTIDLYPRLSSSLVYEHMGKREKHEDILANKPLPTSIVLVDQDGVEATASLIDAQIVRDMRYYTYTQPHEFYFHRCQFVFQAAKVPAMGYKTYRIITSDGHTAKPVHPAGQCASMENDRFKVLVDAGNISILDKRTGKQFDHCAVLKDDVDVGDEYYFQGVPDMAPTRDNAAAAKAQLIVDTADLKTIRIQSSIDVVDYYGPRDEKGNLAYVSCPFTTEVSLRKDTPYVAFQTTVQNNVGNHRLRVHFTGDVATDRYYCDSAFYVDEYSVKDPMTEPNAVLTAPQKSFVAVDGANDGFALLQKGLPEVQVQKCSEGMDVAITLLRCVKMIANGIHCLEYPTPEGQCLGEHTFEYAFAPYEGTWQSNGIDLTARRYNLPMRTKQVAPGSKPTIFEKSYLEIASDRLRLSAFKRSEWDENLMILRLYNCSNQPVKSNVDFRFSVKQIWNCDLREQKLDALDMTGCQVTVEASPWEIITLGVELEKK